MLHLIEEQGYATEKQLLDEVKLYFRGQQRYKEEQLKRCLGEIIDNYGLQRVRLDKRLKELLIYTDNSYPFVIMFAD